jgi:hypothetical protein
VFETCEFYGKLWKYRTVPITDEMTCPETSTQGSWLDDYLFQMLPLTAATFRAQRRNKGNKKSYVQLLLL